MERSQPQRFRDHFGTCRGRSHRGCGERRKLLGQSVADDARRPTNRVYPPAGNQRNGGFDLAPTPLKTRQSSPPSVRACFATPLPPPAWRGGPERGGAGGGG